MLKDKSRIVRGVAAMLNASGGEIWIGVREEGEMPVEVEGVADAAEERRRLEDALCDLLEPPWSDKVGRIAEVGHGDKKLLVVVCEASAPARPFAVVGREGRDYLTRAGARVRRMFREEIAHAFQATITPPPGDGMKAITEFRALVTDKSRFGDRFWMLAAPDVSRKFPFEDEAFRNELRASFTDPTRSGNRSAGFTVFNRFQPLTLSDEAISLGAPDDARWSLGFDVSGTLRYHVPLAVPAFNAPFRERHRLWPFALCELPVSFLRLLDALYEVGQVDDSTPVLIDMGLTGARAWTLSPYSPDTVGYMTEERTLETDEVLWSDPLRVTRADLCYSSRADHVAWRAVTRIYRAFGYEGDVLPREWNRATKRLELKT